MTDEITKRRREICSNCEHLKYIIGVKNCGVCGCVIWAKTQLFNTECPIGKWGPGDKFDTEDRSDPS